MKTRFLVFVLLALFNKAYSQNTFNYTVELLPVSIPNMPGLHSYVHAQHNGKWLLLGGRADGVHARQPFNAFPQAQNNTNIYVVDIATSQVWSAPVTTLPAGIAEQMQSTNMCFYQDSDTLYIAGGYAFSATANDHITFPNLTTIDVPGLINAVIAGTTVAPYLKQITDLKFAVTGGQLGKINNTFYLVGGHKFDGRYNPMGNPSYTQTYTSQIRKFTVNNSGVQLSYANYDTITDAVHLHRRDYNLIPQLFNGNTPGYTISSGVFQTNVDLPYQYPVDITEAGYTPITTFSQKLSNYHSAHASMFDSISNTNYTLFFGGMAQYYYQNGTLVQDNYVPFVKTISLLARYADNTLQEFVLPIEMPGLQGASAEFIPNHLIGHAFSDIIKLNPVADDTILIGHILGGINSTAINAFTNNQTNLTSANTGLYAVRLINNAPMNLGKVEGKNSFDFSMYPNPANGEVTLKFNMDKNYAVTYFITNAAGQLIKSGDFETRVGTNTKTVDLHYGNNCQTLYITLVFNKMYYATKPVFVN